VFGLLVNLYLENDKKDLAIDYVENLIKEKFELDYIEKLMDITKISKERLRAFILQAMENGGYRDYDFTLKYINKIEDRKEIELLLKEKTLGRYYQLLQQEERVAEMFELLDKLSNKKEKFFKKYKKEYPTEATAFFRAEIEENLKPTGNEYYQKIAEYLTHLKELIEEEEFDMMVRGLKLEYKRRRNLVKILEKRFS